MAEITGAPRGEGRRVAIIASRFNETITLPLSEGAVDALTRHGVAFDDIDVIWVPGAWELPSAARKALGSGRYDGVVAVGAVIRGDTPHFDIVAGEAARGLMDASRDFDAPVTLGLLTTDNMEQALARAGGAHGNKGWDAALAALELLDVLDQLEPDDSTGGDA
jgi:6,7-dimethyl-8-ribityllumazine synthase